MTYGDLSLHPSGEHRVMPPFATDPDGQAFVTGRMTLCDRVGTTVIQHPPVHIVIANRTAPPSKPGASTEVLAGPRRRGASQGPGECHRERSVCGMGWVQVASREFHHPPRRPASILADRHLHPLHIEAEPRRSRHDWASCNRASTWPSPEPAQVSRYAPSPRLHICFIAPRRIQIGSDVSR
jgi:hypothetical protein